MIIKRRFPLAGVICISLLYFAMGLFICCCAIKGNCNNQPYVKNPLCFSFLMVSTVALLLRFLLKPFLQIFAPYRMEGGNRINEMDWEVTFCTVLFALGVFAASFVFKLDKFLIWLCLIISHLIIILLVARRIRLLQTHNALTIPEEIKLKFPFLFQAVMLAMIIWAASLYLFWTTAMLSIFFIMTGLQVKWCGVK